MADLDGDGISDLLYADRSGDVSFHKRTASGNVEPAVKIVADGKKLSPGSAASVCMTDWNGDSLFDLIIGHGIWTKDYPLQLYINKGSKTSYLYENPDTLKCNGEIIGATYPQIEFADLTGDGIRDLVLLDCFYNSQMGTDTTNLFFYENSGSDTEPVFMKRDTMSYNGLGMGKKLGTLDATDLNGDGGIDLAVTGTGRDFKIYYGKPGDVAIVEKLKNKNIDVPFSIVKGTLYLPQNCSFLLTTVEGRVVRSGTASGKTTLTGFSTGMYFLQLEDSGAKWNYKILIP